MVRKVDRRNLNMLERISFKVINWIGTPQSLLVHTLIFLTIPAIGFFGFDERTILLGFTTWLSIEAIYLAIFIQMTVNRTTRSLEEVGEDIEGIQEDVEELSEDIDQIQEDEQLEEEDVEQSLDNLESQVQKVLADLEHLKKQVHEHTPSKY